MTCLLMWGSVIFPYPPYYQFFGEILWCLAASSLERSRGFYVNVGLVVSWEQAGFLEHQVTGMNQEAAICTSMTTRATALIGNK